MMCYRKSSKIKIHALLCGGIGNQLFIYAMARALAIRNKSELVLELSLFKKDKTYKRSFELESFTLPNDILILRHSPLEKYRRKWLVWYERNHAISQRSYLIEPQPYCYSLMFRNLQLNRKVTLHGYWQSPKYFEDVEDVIRQELRIKNPLPSQMQALALTFERETSIAVHVRRTQYDSKLNIEYYHRSLLRMRERFPEAKFYVFSDEPSWWYQNGDNGSDVTVLEDGGATAIDEFNLMSRCKHFIIANSSFSWWAAWLGSYDGKIVISPSQCRWFNLDILPDTWEIIPD